MGKKKKKISKRDMKKSRNILNYKDNKIVVYPTCNPKCIFFPRDMACTVWSYDEFGVKHRGDNRDYICGYSGKKIENWKDICPFYKDKISGKFDD